MNFVSHQELYGQRSILTIGLSPRSEREPTQNYENIFGHPGATTARGIGSSINVPAYLENQLYITSRFSILAGAQAILRSVISRTSSWPTRTEINQIGKIFGASIPTGRDLRSQSQENITSICEFQS